MHLIRVAVDMEMGYYKLVHTLALYFNSVAFLHFMTLLASFSEVRGPSENRTNGIIELTKISGILRVCDKQLSFS